MQSKGPLHPLSNTGPIDFCMNRLLPPLLSGALFLTAWPLSYGMTPSAQILTHNCTEKVSESITARRSAPMRTPSAPITLPYVETFNDASAENNFYIVTLSGNPWKYANGAMRVQASNDRAMNTYLITAPMTLKAGKTYTFTFKARCHNDYYTEKIAAYIGTGNTESDMTETIVPVSNITTTEFSEFSGTFSPSATGTFHFGIRGCSDAGSFYLWLDDIRITENAEATAPEAPQLTGLPDYNREKKAMFTITAPTKDIEGNALESISKIELRRGNTIVKTFENPAPGSEMTYEDALAEEAEEGYYTYTAIAYAGNKAGAEQPLRLYMGVNIPGPATNATAYEAGDSGYIVVTWDPAETDIDGYPMNPALAHYVVYSNNGDLVDEDITGNVCAAQYTSLTQRYLFFCVMSESSAGLNDQDFPQSNFVSIGTPYTLPYQESFANGKLSTAYAIEGRGDLKLTEALEGFPATPSDDDNGMLTWTSLTDEAKALLMAGKISVPENAANPVVMFQYYKVSGSQDKIILCTNTAQYYMIEDYQPLHEICIGDGNDGWNRVIVPISDLKGSTFKPAFLFSAAGQGTTFAIDDIRVIDLLDKNLKIRSSKCPRKVYAGTEMVLSADIENYGAETADNYTVELYCGDKLVNSVSGTPLASGERTLTEISFIPPATSAAQLNFSIKVNFSGDGDLTDNTSRQYTVDIASLPYPKVQSVEGTATTESILITWDPIDLLTAKSEPYTEDFEDYTPFEINNAGDWSFADVDGQRTWGISGIDFPNEQLPMAFIVFNAVGYHTTMAAHSGVQYMSAMSARGGVQSDDWMISPATDTASQEISMWVSSQSTAYGSEKFEVLASSGGIERNEFTVINSCTDIPQNDWIKHTATLPEGTRHFAIRAYETNLMFRIDDITYIPALPELTLLGYNIYRDNDRINEALLTSPEFNDTSNDGLAHVYNVTAVYDKGESRPSDNLNIAFSDMNSIPTAKISIFSIDGGIRISGAEGGFTIYSVSGNTVASGSSSEATVALRPGIYLITTSGGTIKTAVR